MSGLPEPWTTIYVALAGLAIGSFLNVCIHRLPLGHSIVRPRSRCPRCGHEIRWRENIPIVSWLALGRRCSGCRERISVRYPLVELIAGGIAVACWSVFGATIAFPVATVFCFAMVVLFFTDFDHQLLPDAVTLSGFVVGLALAWINPFLPAQGLAGVWSALSGAALGAGLLWGFGALYGRLRGVEAMGLGDVKMMAMVGAFTGPFGVLVTIFGGSLVGAVVGVAMIPLRGRTLQDVLPFGCFLAPAALFALFAGRRVAEYYLGLVLPTP